MILLAGCGGGGSSESARTAAAAEANSALEGTGHRSALALPGAAVSQLDAVRLAQQASFGPSEALVAEIQAQGAAGWVQAQQSLATSRYESGGNGKIHEKVGPVGFCSTKAQRNNVNCWRDFYSTEPLVWDFYRNATSQPDQLRQRVALALHQILVVSGLEVSGTYGFRYHHNTFLDLAFGNYRDVLRKVTLSPLMGDFLNSVNNDKFAPNENYAREMLQLFSLGNCLLNADGTQDGARCRPVYDNNTVRNYAFALTGWTYPRGGGSVWGCGVDGANCQYYGGDMVGATKLRDRNSRVLLSGKTLPQGSTAEAALGVVLDSLMAHRNIAPFVSKQLIQQLVSSNPSAAYVARVATAFRTGSFSATQDGVSFAFGRGRNGDLAATVAAILLDPEARDTSVNPTNGGKLRAPVLMFTAALRGLNGYSDGAPFAWGWGEALKQPLFRPPSVFSYYSPSYPLAGSTLAGPEFGIHNANGVIGRFNFMTYLLDWGGSAPDSNIPGAIGTGVKLDAFLPSAPQPSVLVDRLSMVLIGQALAVGPRNKVIEAVRWWDGNTAKPDWQRRRVFTAAYLIMNSPEFQVQR